MDISNLTTSYKVANSSLRHITKSTDPLFNSSILAASTSESSQAKGAEQSTDANAVMMNTNKGNVEVNLDHYFTKKPAAEGVNLEDIPLLLPTEHNVNRLAGFTERKVKALLAEYNIPEPPKTVSFDQSGELVLPNDYVFKKEFEQALSDNPETLKAMRTTHALSSHYANMLERQPLIEELGLAKNDEDRERIASKYSYLLGDSREYVDIVLNFTEDATMTIGVENSKFLTQLNKSHSY